MTSSSFVTTPPLASSGRSVHVDLAEHGHAKVRHGLRPWQRRHRALTVATDMTAALVGLTAGLAGRTVVVGEDAPLWGSTQDLQVTSVVIAALWLVLLARHGAYATRIAGAGADEYRTVLRAAATLVAVVAFVSFSVKLEFSRGVLLVAVPTMTAATIAARHLLRQRLATARDRGECLQPTLLVGDAGAVAELARRIGAAPRTTGLAVRGVCLTQPADLVRPPAGLAGVPLLGSLDDTLRVVDSVGAEVVAVATGPALYGEPLQRLGWALEQRNVDLLIDPGVIEVAGPRLTLRPASGLPMLHVERPVCSGARYAVKLAVDRLIALVALVLGAPLLLAIGLLVVFDSRGPVLYGQRRVGEGGRTFTMLKFRTMCVDADARREELEGQNEGHGALFKLHRDPRITRVGAVLRRYSLDELPQLANVVRGEMSLVGPRPPLPAEVDQYQSAAVRRLRVRPGMTGLWQVSGRSDLSWVESVRLDLWYVDNWSLAVDAQILLRTAGAVVRGRGAY